MTIKAGVVGSPISHSLSPTLHRFWLDKYGINGSYDPILVSPGKLAEDVQKLKEKGLRGVNVTIPHKEAAFELADIKGHYAAATGAANLLVFMEDGSIRAENTDGVGLVDSLEVDPINGLGVGSLGGRNIVVLGAGGAAKGIVEALYGRGVASITVLNRHAEKAEQLIERAGLNRTNVKFKAGPLTEWKNVAGETWLVINTTSAGMKGAPPLDIDLSDLPETATVCDIVYNPLVTPLLKDAQEHQLRTVDGLGMLMYQAAPSFQAFFYPDKAVPPTPEVTPALRAALLKELASRG